ncbi:unnamed protein product [Caenorhabditis angaria]|uniref:7TM GPCR serpentine receptor class x (Srx) domain-containing protein n=1 Tax=Caenorhabditis angaria TaxID=860376 RepID=A0A9P1IT86_9PELO|nr:unnamed protein product [Caenorhabditis angaria]
MNSSTTLDIEDDSSEFLSILAAFIITANSVFGIYCNFLVFKNFITNKNERTSFNMICFFRSYVNIHILSTIFLDVFVPATILGYSIYNPAIESSIISFGITLYFANDYGALVVALNRLFALYFPMTYSKVFGMKPTFGILVLIHVFQIVIIVQELIGYIPKKCFLYFNVSQLAWSPTFEPQCISYGGDSTLYYFGGIFILLCIIDTFTLIKIINIYKTETIVSRQKISQNAYLFLQTCAQDSLFVLDIVFTFKLASLSNARLWTFISGTVVWQCLHSFDGYIMMMFGLRSRNKPKHQITAVISLSRTTST